MKIGPETGPVRTIRILSGPADRPGARPLEQDDWRGTDKPGDGRITRQKNGALLIRIPGFRLERVPSGYPLPFLPQDTRPVHTKFG